jgi:hypothetical protein
VFTGTPHKKTTSVFTTSKSKLLKKKARSCNGNAIKKSKTATGTKPNPPHVDKTYALL